MKTYATLTALTLWTVLSVVFTAGAGNRSIAGPIKGPDFLFFYTSGYLGRTGQISSLYDITSLHKAQVELVPESGPELYPPVYPPQIPLLFEPISALSYRRALLVWTFITVITFSFTVYHAWRRVARWIPDGRFVLATAACFPPFWFLVLYGQATIIVLLAFWVTFIALEHRSNFLAGCALSILLLKPQFGVVVAVVALCCGEWRLIAGGIAGMFAQLAAIVLLWGRDVLILYGHFLLLAVRHADLLEPKPYQSHSVRALTRLMPAFLGIPLWICISAGVCWCCIRVWRTHTSSRIRVSVVILGSILVDPHVIVYDATVLSIPLIWIGAHLTEHGKPVRSYWRLVFWLFVTLLAPTAIVAKVQASVLLLLAVFYLITREVLDGRPENSPGAMGEDLSSVRRVRESDQEMGALGYVV